MQKWKMGTLGIRMKIKGRYTREMMSKDILPCPLCGNVMMKIIVSTDTISCKCGISFKTKSKHGSIEIWNNKNPSSINEKIEQLKEEIDEMKICKTCWKEDDCDRSDGSHDTCNEWELI